MKSVRVVLDTNIVVSALLFAGDSAGRIRHGWQAQRLTPLASNATAQELVRALGYPKFGLTAAEREDLLADYLPWVEAVRIPEPPPAVPRCRDPADIPFLQLALAGRARVLVSGDRDLLELAGSLELCPVLGMAEFVERFLGT